MQPLGDHLEITAPKPFIDIFREVCGENNSYAYQLMIMPAQKFSFNPPQLHTIRDLSADEWYNFDWLGVLGGMYNKIPEDSRNSEKATILKGLIDRLKEILPAAPTAKDINEAFLWNELKNSAITPWTYFVRVVNGEYTKRLAELCEVYGVNYSKSSFDDISALRNEHAVEFDQLLAITFAYLELGKGSHLQSDTAALTTYNKYFAELIEAAQNDPNYAKSMDETLPAKERQAAQIELDKMLQALLDKRWAEFLASVKEEALYKEPIVNELFSVTSLKRHTEAQSAQEPAKTHTEPLAELIRGVSTAANAQTERPAAN